MVALHGSTTVPGSILLLRAGEPEADVDVEDEFLQQQFVGDGVQPKLPWQ